MSKHKKRKEHERRVSVATNAAATALFGVGTGQIWLSDLQVAAARAIAERVVCHLDEYDRSGNG